MPSKVCTTCGKEKPLSDYYHNSKAKDGHHASCKQCQAKSQGRSNRVIGRKIRKLTKEDLQFIVDSWDEMEIDEMVHKLRMTKTTFMGHVTSLRKFGVDLPKKNRNAGNRKVIMDFAEEWVKNHPTKK